MLDKINDLCDRLKDTARDAVGKRVDVAFVEDELSRIRQEEGDYGSWEVNAKAYVSDEHDEGGVTHVAIFVDASNTDGDGWVRTSMGVGSDKDDLDRETCRENAITF